MGKSILPFVYPFLLLSWLNHFISSHCKSYWLPDVFQEGVVMVPIPSHVLPSFSYLCQSRLPSSVLFSTSQWSQIEAAYSHMWCDYGLDRTWYLLKSLSSAPTFILHGLLISFLPQRYDTMSKYAGVIGMNRGGLLDHIWDHWEVFFQINWSSWSPRLDYECVGTQLSWLPKTLRTLLCFLYSKSRAL